MRLLFVFILLIFLFGCVDELEYPDELISIEGCSEEGRPDVIAYSSENSLFLELRNPAYEGIGITKTDFEIKRYNANFADYMKGDYSPELLECVPVNAERYKSVLRLNLSCSERIAEKSQIYEVDLTFDLLVPKEKTQSEIAFPVCVSGDSFDNCTVNYKMVFLSK
ncbi:hypothetical protein JXB01_00595 [Candidatus Micrarchaeota archaeon]|nr:hypothetical protein [Candidatus Micrarchaeota archaeon]